MKRKSFYLAVAVVSAVILNSCNGLKKMEKYIEELGAKASPNPLELHGDSVEISISGKFPPKYFAKKASVEATPVLVYEGGETKYKMDEYKGEQAAGNGKVVPYKEGKSFSYTDRVAYTPAMEVSKLELRIHGVQGKKMADFAPVPVADGVIITPLLQKTDGKVLTTTDRFVPVTPKSMEAVINFDYNSSNLKPAELKDADIAELGKFLDSCSRNPKLVIKSIELISFASPEGEMLLNDDLANERAAAGQKALNDMIKKMKITTVTEGMVKLTPKGEDWEGFRSAMEKSNIEDRNIIINVLQMTSDLQQRETEIKNISKTYTQIQKDIFPSLRRCRIVVNYDEQGYTDAELKAIGTSNPSVLKYEELMRAGSLVDDLNQKVSIYSAAAAKPEADYRAVTNLGAAYYMLNKTGDADTQFKKAYGMAKNKETANNLGVATHISGDREGAMKYYNEAGSGSETTYNKGLISIQKGDYSTAVSNMSGFKTFNSALAKLLNKDYSGAKADLDASGDKSAMADYLAAVIAARNNDTSAAVESLKSAVQKDASLAAKAKRDLEFRNFKDQLTF